MLGLGTYHTQEDGKWDRLIRKGYLEYIDADEEETTMISMTIKDLRNRIENPYESKIRWFTHGELHPSLVLGISASMIPFLEHNPPYRNTTQASTNKCQLPLWTHLHMFCTILKNL